jgi:hypothetical protein
MQVFVLAKHFVLARTTQKEGNIYRYDVFLYIIQRRKGKKISKRCLYADNLYRNQKKRQRQKKKNITNETDIAGT